MSASLNSGWRLTGVALAWLAGGAVHLQQASLFPVEVCVAALLAGLIGLGAGFGWRKAYWAAVFGAALLAWGVAGWRASERWDDVLPAALEDREITVTGVVASLPQRTPSGLRFRFAVDEGEARLAGRPAAVPGNLALGWYKGYHDDAALAQPRSELRAGQRWRFTLKLRRPHGNLNPHGFDYELNLFEQGLRATGYVRDYPAPVLLDRAAGFPIERLRQRVRDAIEASVPDPRAAGVLAALAVGDQAAIARDDWDLYRNTGIAHLVSISGLHITMFAWLAGLGIAALWRRSMRAMLWLPVPLAARWGGLLAATAYALFSGWGVPSQRTVWMLVTVTLLQSLGLHWPWALVLLSAAVVVTALDPWAVLQAGFWLSFMAVGLLMASAPAQIESAAGDQSALPAVGWRGWPVRLWLGLWHSARDGTRTQMIATLGLTPLTLVFFQQVSVVGFIANLIAIPLVTLVITPLALLGVALVPLWSIGAWVVRQLNLALTWLASWPGAVWVVPVAPAWAQLAGLFGAALLVMPLPWRARALGLPLLLALLWPAHPQPAAGTFDVLALDVGQGTSVLVRTQRHLLLFDAGPQYSLQSDAGDRVLLPLLRASGDTRIDRLVLSHRDTDHVGGARALLTQMRVDDLLSSLETGHPLLALARHETRCHAGQSWIWDGVRFDVLRPQEADYARTLKSNAMSCVLRVSSREGRSLLLTGDIERDQEALLVSEYGDALRSDVLIVPHHGSRTSSTAAFLDAVSPKVAVFQAGYRNRFGHPAPDVLARYRDRGITVQISPDCGAWRWQSQDPPTPDPSMAAPQVHCERDLMRRYWHAARMDPAP